MASLSVAAIVVSHAQADKLTETLNGIANQSHPLEQVVVVETAGDLQSLELARSFGFSTISPGKLGLGAAIQAGIDSLSKVPGWIWILHDDAAPESQALAAMAEAAEISPSVAVVGSKLLNATNPIEIQQMGLTTTRTGRPFLLAEKQYDQGQHDAAGDTLAVSTASMLIALGVWQLLSGLDDRTPPLAQDIEFCAKARAAGFRVIVQANSRVNHHGLSMRNGRERSWLKGDLTKAMAKAHIHLATIFLPLPVTVLLYLAMPLLVAASIPLHLLAKRPGRVVGQLAGWFWAWTSFGERFAARRRFRVLGDGVALRSLMATRKQVSARRRASFEIEPDYGEHALRPGFVSSNSAWFVLLPLLASMQLFPQGAIGANGLLPLGSSLEKIWGVTSIQHLPYLDAVVLPSDPFTWMLSLAGLLSLDQPSLGLAWIVFLAPTLAFIGAWHLTKFHVAKSWVVTLVALGYALSPQLLTLKAGLSVPELLASAFLPWALFFIQAAVSSFNTARSWRWTGLAGLALAALATTTPGVYYLIVLILVVLVFLMPRRGWIAFWSLLPGLVILLPWIQFAIELQEPAILTVSSSIASEPAEVLEFVNLITLAFLAFLALGTWWVSSLSRIAGLWALAIGALALSWYQPLAGSQSLVLLGLLALLILGGIVLQTAKGTGVKVILSSLATIALAGSATLVGWSSQANPSWQQSRVMPAVVVAASEVDSQVRTLVIESSTQIHTYYVWGSGVTLDRKSFAYDWVNPTSKIENQIAQATASLIAGNADEFSIALESLDIDFVLLKSSNPQIEVAINGVAHLQAAGKTELGSLWKTNSSATSTAKVEDHPMKPYQIAMLMAFALLAVPTRSSIRGYRKIKTEVMG